MFDRKEYMKEWNKKYYKNNREKIREQKKKYYFDNRKKRIEQSIQWAKDNPEKIKEYNKKWREKNPEYNEKYFRMNGKIINIRNYTKNKEKILKRNKQYREENPKRMSEYKREWKKTEKGKANNQRSNSKRRTRERNIINTLTAQEWLNILEEFNYRCAYCGGNRKLSRDHIIPISKGGNNTKENIVPACQSCNSRKGNRLLIGGIYAI